MKKLLSIVLTLVLIVSVVPVGVFTLTASAVTSGITGDCTWALNGTELTISGSGKMANYTAGSKLPWGNKVTKVTFNYGVTSVGDYAFYKFPNLKKVTFSKSIKTIGSYAFYECEQLENFTLPSALSSIGDGAFKDCESLTRVTIPDNVKTIGLRSFYGCYFSNLTIGKNVKSIGSYAFAFNNFTSLVLPNGLTSIGYSAFEYCRQLKSVVLPKTVTSIGNYAFDCDENLTDVWYSGNQTDESKISIGSENTSFIYATWHYNICNVNPLTYHEYDNDCDKSCNICGIERTVPAHKYDSGVVTTKATCTKNGVKTYTCTVCGATKKESITKLGHTYSSDCDSTCNTCGAWRHVDGHEWKNGKCTICGYKLAGVRITTQPKTAYATNGQKVYTTVYAKGEGLTYTWYVKDVGDTKYYKSSLTTNTYSLKITDKNSNRQAYCVITDKYGNSVKTDVVYLRQKVSIVTQPKTGYAEYGSKAAVTVVAKGDDLKYTWYVTDPGDTKYYKSSQKTNVYSVKINNDNNNRRAYCVITDKYGNSVRTETVYLRQKAAIKTQPTTGYAEYGKKASITVKATGNELKYTWYVKDVGDTKYYKSSQNTKTYSIKVNSITADRKVYCVITDKYGNAVRTETVVLKVKPVKTSVSKVTPATKKLTVSFAKKTSGTTGYQIQYSTNKNFTNAKSKWVTKNTTTKATITGLKAKTTYYVRVRTYKTVNGKKYYSGWSTVKSAKTK